MRIPAVVRVVGGRFDMDEEQLVYLRCDCYAEPCDMWACNDSTARPGKK